MTDTNNEYENALIKKIEHTLEDKKFVSERIANALQRAEANGCSPELIEEIIQLGEYDRKNTQELVAVAQALRASNGGEQQ